MLTIIYLTFLANLVLSFFILLIDYNKMKKSPVRLLIMVILPVLGLLFYILVSDNGLIYKKDRRSKLEEVNNNMTFDNLLIEKTVKALNKNGFLVTSFDSVNIYDSPNYYDALVNDIANAKEHIIIGVSAFKNDVVGKRIVSALMSKDSNVKIFIVYERFVSKKRQFRKLKKRHNVVVIPYKNPNKKWQSHPNYTYHNKLVVIDNYAYIGSVNIDKRELGQRRVKDWHDLMMRFTGQIVHQVYDKLVDDLIDSGCYRLEKKDNTIAGESIAFIYSDAGRNRQKTLDVFNTWLGCSKKITILSPFVSINEAMTLSMRTAIKNGTEINFVIPMKKDNILLHYTTFSHIKKLFDLGVNIYLSPEFHHTKMIISDTQAAYIGSCNFQTKALIDNCESGAVIFNEELISECQKICDKLIIKSIQINERNIKKHIKPKRFLFRLIRLLGW